MGRPATTIMGKLPDAPAAVKGPLRRPPAALDRRLSRRSPLAPFGTMGAVVDHSVHAYRRQYRPG